MRKILKFLKKYWYFAILAPLFMIGEVMMDMVITNVMGLMIDVVKDFVPATDSAIFLHTILKYGLIMLGFCLVGITCGIFGTVFANLASHNMGNDLRKATFAKIMNLSFNQVDNFQTGSLVTRVTNDITTVQNTVRMTLRMFIRAFCMFIFGIVFTIKISPKFAWVIAFALPLETIGIIFFMKKAFPMFTIVQKKLDKVNNVMHENLSGARVVKAFCKEEHEEKRFKEANDNLTSINLMVNKMLSFAMPLFMLIIYMCQLSIFYIGGKEQFNAFVGGIAPGITLGDTQTAIMYLMMIMMGFMALGMTIVNMSRAVASVKRINEVLDAPEELPDGDLDVSTLKEQGTLAFNNVDFSYFRTGQCILNNVNFKINKGETIAIVGSTGSGKSTIVNLIDRFYDVTDGEILVDGVDVRKYKKTDLRKKVSLVLQKAELFAGTIFENITWGKPDATIDEVMEACDIAQANEFILSKPNQYNEYIEEKGTSLSGGQKQRLSIARAIISKPEFLIFDDSTSALDLVTEAKLQQALREKLSDTTKIIVAQRVATVKNCDKIIVLDGGTVVAFDTHDNLLKTCDVYKDIYDSQLKKEVAVDE